MDNFTAPSTSYLCFTLGTNIIRASSCAYGILFSYWLCSVNLCCLSCRSKTPHRSSMLRPVCARLRRIRTGVFSSDVCCYTSVTTPRRDVTVYQQTLEYTLKKSPVFIFSSSLSLCRPGGAGSVRDQQSQSDSADRRLVLCLLLLLQRHDEGGPADQSEQGRRSLSHSFCFLKSALCRSLSCQLIY